MIMHPTFFIAVTCVSKPYKNLFFKVYLDTRFVKILASLDTQ